MVIKLTHYKRGVNVMSEYEQELKFLGLDTIKNNQSWCARHQRTGKSAGLDVIPSISDVTSIPKTR